MTEPRAPKLEGRRFLLTGGAGFIGSHLTERLAPDSEVLIDDALRRHPQVPLVGHPRSTPTIHALAEEILRLPSRTSHLSFVP